MKRAHLLYLILAIAASAQAQRLADLVDTRVGTAVAITGTAGVFGQGTEEYAHTLPAVLVPYGMNFWTPETQGSEAKGVCPYLYQDDTLRGIRCSHWLNGGCTQDYGSFTLSPTRGISSLRFRHQDETALPYYYRVMTEDGSIQTEVTATERCGIVRLTYQDADEAYLTLTVNSDEQQGEITYDSIGHRILARNPCHRIYQGWGQPTGTSGWMVLTLDKPILGVERLNQHSLCIHFAPTHQVVVRAACSFTGYEGASLNLATELPHSDFDATKTALSAIWEQKLSQIRVSGEQDSTLLRTFYGCLYRTSFLPHKISDVDGRYPRFAQGDALAGDPQTGYYDDFSMWDTYRAQHPLLTLLEPTRNGHMMQSLVEKYKAGGWLPIFPCWNSYTAAMIGDHCTVALADAYVKGIRNFDIQTAYEGMRKNASETPATHQEYADGMGRRALDSYLRYGYIPLEDSIPEAFHQHEQTSRTLEYAFDDYALAQVARMLGKKTDAHTLMRRSQSWQHVFDPQTGWASGRHADGTFVTPKDIQYIREPEKHPDSHWLTPTTFSTFITEGTPVHYSWYVPHDIPGLVRQMGGRRQFEARLDSMFQRGWYWHGNEPCHQIAYLYSAIGKPSKTAQVVRHIMTTEYLDAPGGLSGNDDAGQMSSWYIFSALGFYPVCPATPDYYLGLPLFPETIVQLENGRTLTIRLHGTWKEDSQIRSIRWNGRRLSSPRITHEEILRGGTLEFSL